MIRIRPWGLTVLVVSFLTSLASCNSGNQQTAQPAAAPDTRAEEEAKIRATDADWVKAAGAKDLAQTVSFYADGGALMAPGAPLATGKDAITKTFKDFMANPGFALSFSPAKVEVSKSGDLAYELGHYELTMNDKKGKPQTAKGAYVVVWGKQADGTWKALVDAPTTTTLP
jgi:uncharacterized protein (TIGR02246 family)